MTTDNRGRLDVSTMATGRYLARARLAAALATCSLILLPGVTGCASSGAKSTPATTGQASPTQQAAQPADPAWAKALGANVTIIPPGKALPGNGSPGAVVQGLADALNSGKLETYCRYFTPSTQALCRKDVAGAPAGAGPTMKGFALGYVAIDGDRALVGVTATLCQPGQTPECAANHNPAAIFSTSKSFAALWAESVTGSNSPAVSYSLTPCLKTGGRWYLYSSQT